MASESKKRVVLQLLRDYRAWHTAFGGAVPVDDAANMVDTSYGPAGVIEAGQAFAPRDRARLAKSYEALEHALTMLKTGGPLRRAAYLVLLPPCLGDPGDASLVAEWRRDPKDCRVRWHDLAVEELAEFLKNENLYVIFPKRMTSREEKQVERRNDEFFALYRHYRHEDRMSRNKTIEMAAEHCGYGRSRGYEIVEIREGKAS